MTNYITLSGQQHPVSFSNAAQLIYQRKFGRSMHGDFLRLVNGASALMQGNTELPFSDELCCIAYAGIANGYRIDGRPVPSGLDEFAIADALLSDEKAVSELTTLYAESLPKPKTDEGEKKTTPGATPAE